MEINLTLLTCFQIKSRFLFVRDSRAGKMIDKDELALYDRQIRLYGISAQQN